MTRAKQGSRRNVTSGQCKTGQEILLGFGSGSSCEQSALSFCPLRKFIVARRLLHSSQAILAAL